MNPVGIVKGKGSLHDNTYKSFLQIITETKRGRNRILTAVNIQATDQISSVKRMKRMWRCLSLF